MGMEGEYLLGWISVRERKRRHSNQELQQFVCFGCAQTEDRTASVMFACRM